MRVLPRSLLALAAKIASAVQEARKPDEPEVVEFLRVPRLSHVAGRRHTYYWPGRRVAASLRTSGKVRRMR